MQTLLITNEFKAEHVHENTELSFTPLSSATAERIIQTYNDRVKYDTAEVLKNGIPYDLDILCINGPEAKHAYTYIR
jgi:hypothetical protein